MTNEKKQDFTRRICNANETELLALVLEMTDAYLEDFLAELGDKEKTKKNYEHVLQCIRHLQKNLYLGSEMGQNLFSIYQFVENEVTKAQIKQKAGHVMECRTYLQTLADSLWKLGEKDTSKPVMENAEKLYVGLTYSGQGLDISSSSLSGNRGYLA